MHYYLSALMQELRLCKVIPFFPLCHSRALEEDCKVRRGRSTYCSFLFAASGLLLCSLCLRASSIIHTCRLSSLGFFPRQQLFSNIRETWLITPSSGTPVLASAPPLPRGVVPLPHKPSSELRVTSTSQAASTPQVFELQLHRSFPQDFDSFFICKF